MNRKTCQSCGMPIDDAAWQATNADQSNNEDYCCCCYENGHFTMDCTMEQQIEHCARFVDESDKDAAHPLTRQEAIAQMRLYFPQLKRWKQIQ